MSRYSDLVDDVPTHIPNPQTAEDAIHNLRHTLAVFDHPAGGGPVDRDRFVVEATRGYTTSPTGLTWQDLHLINEALTVRPFTVPPPSGATPAPAYATGGWIRDEFRRASDRAASLPPWARPTVTRPVFNGGETDADLPGMWERADFLGGSSDVVRTSGPLDTEVHAALVRSVERSRGVLAAVDKAGPP